MRASISANVEKEKSVRLLWYVCMSREIPLAEVDVQ
jgi:hypothetical protein